MPELDRLGIEHLDEALDVGFVNAGKNIIEDENRVLGTVHPGERKEDAKPKSVQMRITEIGLWRRARLATEAGADFQRGAFVGVEFEANLVQPLAGMNEFVDPPDLTGDFNENAVGEKAAFLFDDFQCSVEVWQKGVEFFLGLDVLGVGLECPLQRAYELLFVQ